MFSFFAEIDLFFEAKTFCENQKDEKYKTKN